MTDPQTPPAGQNQPFRQHQQSGQARHAAEPTPEQLLAIPVPAHLLETADAAAAGRPRTRWVLALSLLVGLAGFFLLVGPLTSYALAAQGEEVVDLGRFAPAMVGGGVLLLAGAGGTIAAVLWFKSAARTAKRTAATIHQHRLSVWSAQHRGH
ncbi:hypothetical protein [Arthrobacter sp. 35W]|uniref:hypothetical protein n=1 Tax=Arthrobacter sp. 35W TaxID=1132441 RepID=UPI00041374C1|nr:hypothetical protein [Arthrobacter sp. 35W]